MPEVVIVKDGKELSRKRLEKAALSIGRDAGNDVVLADPAVSRVHAKIHAREGAFVLEDRFSTRGSFVSGKKIIEHALADGDEISIGEHRLFFFKNEGMSLPARPAAAQATASDGSGAWAQVGTMLLQPERAQEGVERLKALLDISRLLETTRDFHAVLVELMDKAIAVMGADRGVLLLKEPESGELRIAVARSRGQDIPREELETFSRSIVREVQEKGRPLLLQDAGTQEWGTQSILAHSIRSVLCVPLKTQETVTGVISVDHLSKAKAFSELDLAFFTTFALQAKAAIDASRSYWELVESLFAASNDLVLLTDPEGVVTRANKAAAAGLVGRPFESAVSEPDREKAAQLCGTLRVQGTASPLELRVQGSRGLENPMSVSGFALRDRRGTVMGLCLIGRDLTELKALMAKLSELNDMKSQYVGMVSHELKGPMTILRGFIDIILDDPKAQLLEAHRGYLDLMRGRIDQVTTLISDLLDLTRIETGKIDLKLKAVDLKALVEEVVGDYQRLAQQQDVAVSVEAAVPAPAAEADEGMLRRVIANFTSNGIKYNRKGGALRIGISTSENDCVLAFQDQGVGISPEDQAKLFGRFFRADAVRDIPGTGLGLSIVLAIVERHGGRIDVDSKLGAGTTFSVRLPLKPKMG